MVGAVMKRLVFTVRADAQRVKNIINRALGLPIRPTKIGCGPWVEDDPGAVEWCSIYRRREPRPVDWKPGDPRPKWLDEWVVVADRHIQAIAHDPVCRARITRPMREEIDAAILAAIDVADDVDDTEDDS